MDTNGWVVAIALSCLTAAALFAIGGSDTTAASSLSTAQDTFTPVGTLSLGFLFGRNSR